MPIDLQNLENDYVFNISQAFRTLDYCDKQIHVVIVKKLMHLRMKGKTYFYQMTKLSILMAGALTIDFYIEIFKLSLTKPKFSFRYVLKGKKKNNPKTSGFVLKSYKT